MSGSGLPGGAGHAALNGALPSPARIHTARSVLSPPGASLTWPWPSLTPSRVCHSSTRPVSGEPAGATWWTNRPPACGDRISRSGSSIAVWVAVGATGGDRNVKIGPGPITFAASPAWRAASRITDDVDASARSCRSGEPAPSVRAIRRSRSAALARPARSARDSFASASSRWTPGPIPIGARRTSRARAVGPTDSASDWQAPSTPASV